MISFGVNRQFIDEPWLKIIKLERPFRVGDEIVTSLCVRFFNYSQYFAPEGKTVIQSTFETDNDWWFSLSNDRSRYLEEKERVASEILNRLEAHYPGMSSQVEITDIATPYTTWRYTLNHKGAYMGWLPTPDALNTKIDKILPGLDNFYMTGQWTMPGGGVLSCLFSGRHIIQILCHRDVKPFQTTVT